MLPWHGIEGLTYNFLGALYALLNFGHRAEAGGALQALLRFCSYLLLIPTALLPPFFAMASLPVMSRIVFCLPCICALLAALTTASLHDDEFFDASFLNIGSGLACDLAKCLKGQCINSTSFPFYKCECNAGWQSPFGASWFPCILPNCSIDLTCANRSAAAPAPSIVVPSFSGGLDVCSLHVCGNGECIHNSSDARNATDEYACMCDPGYVNFGNKADGYCIRKCSIGADCTNVRLPFGGAGNTSPPPPPAVASSVSSASSPSVNQGDVIVARNRILAVTSLALLIMWR
ncbi:hypothetical protein GOP47_0005973 [Adiantum capillus-veneris]|uniref:EGF-like domain-containing protein n=1 Tax=Adiantum capillus-veneris TaxID=13818 RepID=A0A9D4V2V6_ADICA|nr:hypothetical protein GOP47_0005973 [Adiantum capillus-veneris]